jgi:membrane protein DedA with SNARE-associated domain
VDGPLRTGLAAVAGSFRGVTLTFGNCLAGVRRLTANVAGASKLEYPALAAFASSGAVHWRAAFFALDYPLAGRWSGILASDHRFGIHAAIALGAVAAAAGCWW